MGVPGVMSRTSQDSKKRGQGTEDSPCSPYIGSPLEEGAGEQEEWSMDQEVKGTKELRVPPTESPLKLI